VGVTLLSGGWAGLWGRRGLSGACSSSGARRHRPGRRARPGHGVPQPAPLVEPALERPDGRPGRRVRDDSRAPRPAPAPGPRGRRSPPRGGDPRPLLVGHASWPTRRPPTGTRRPGSPSALAGSGRPVGPSDGGRPARLRKAPAAVAGLARSRHAHGRTPAPTTVMTAHCQLARGAAADWHTGPRSPRAPATLSGSPKKAGEASPPARSAGVCAAGAAGGAASTRGGSGRPGPPSCQLAAAATANWQLDRTTAHVPPSASSPGASLRRRSLVRAGPATPAGVGETGIAGGGGTLQHVAAAQVVVTTQAAFALRCGTRAVPAACSGSQHASAAPAGNLSSAATEIFGPENDGARAPLGRPRAWHRRASSDARQGYDARAAAVSIPLDSSFSSHGRSGPARTGPSGSGVAGRPVKARRDPVSALARPGA